MGVMASSREGCSRIMCEKYIDDIGYLCSDCIEDFKKLANVELFRLLKDFIDRKKVKDTDIIGEIWSGQNRDGWLFNS
jgi:hypothetical protein